MKSKKIISGIVIAIIIALQFSFINVENIAYAQIFNNNGKFHYSQLTDEGKKIYDAISKMYEEGKLKTGTQNYDLVDNGYFSEQQIKDHIAGRASLTPAMNAARYAFYADYPEVFYVQSAKLSIRTTVDENNKYHAYIGSGRNANYYVDGFTSEEQVETAIEEFNDIVNKIAEGAKNLKAEQGTNFVTEQIKYVHNEIISNTGYRLESDCTPGNEGFLGTPYGALVKKQAVCEGYARAFKTVLDKIGINCILVQGTHQSEGSAAVPHMWNYVEIEKETLARATEKVWYAVDCTIDDPFLRDSTIDTTVPEFIPGSDIKEGFENTRYCLVGKETMNREHIAIETVEAAGNYSFKYPELNEEDYGIDAITNNNGLLVKMKKDGTETADYKAGDFYISYNGKGYAEAVKEGKYILIKYHEYKPGDDVWNEGNWGYMNPELYAPGAFEDNGNHIYITIPNSEYVEFAVTTLKPSEGLAGFTYQGNGSDFVAKSGKLYNPNGTYKAPPYIKTQTPAPTSVMTVGPTYHIEVTYDDDLVFAKGATQVGYEITSTGPTGSTESKITNLVFDGERKITFNLQFSKMFADDNVSYSIFITGLVGKNSGKAPMEIMYGAQNKILCSYRMNKAKNWEVFARPTLMENEDLSLNGWKTSDGKDVSDKLKSRIALVTTRTTETEAKTMNNMIEGKLSNGKLVTSETYNISLNVCKKYVVKTGHRLRLSLGFPAGYGPDDAGVTFKAYHFTKNAQGIEEVEEIPCVITPYGLIVTCDSFSPFAVAVVENDGTEEQTKSVIVTDSEGGQINNADRENGNIFTLTAGQSRTLKVQADEKHEIEEITVDGKSIEIANKSSMDVVVNYDDIKDSKSGIVDVKFVAKAVVEEEKERNETPVNQAATPAEISVPTIKTSRIGGTIKIEPTISETSGVQYYQWYKEGKVLEGKTDKVLEIAETKKEDSGKYTLKVVTNLETSKAEATSRQCIISIADYKLGDADKNEQITTRDAKLVLQHIVKKITLTGEEFERADVTQDGELTTMDAKLILQHIVKRITL